MSNNNNILKLFPQPIFKYQVDNWAHQEWGDPNVLENSVCSNGNAQFGRHRLS